MKRIPATLLWASSLLLLLPAASCTDTLGGDPDTDARAITFTPAAETRAAVETDFPDGSSFSVWGWYDTDKNVFIGNTVSNTSGAWTYDGGTQYWIAGMTYNFYGVYPVYPQTSSDNGTTATVDATGKITVTKFKCSATGNDAVDLMTAISPSITYEAGTKPQPVAMEFQHELAKVSIVIHARYADVTLQEATLYGIVIQGNMELTTDRVQWTLGKETELTDTPFQYLPNDGHVINMGKEINLWDYLLLIPQSISNLKLKLRYIDSSGNESNSEISLQTPTITRWTAGQSYRYTLSIEPDGILFENLTSDEWGETSSGGSIPIQ